MDKQKSEMELLGFQVKIEEIVRIMISKFNTVFLQPEDIVIQQLDTSDSSMYLIADGACQVKILDQRKNLRLGKLLR